MFTHDNCADLSHAGLQNTLSRGFCYQYICQGHLVRPDNDVVIDEVQEENLDNFPHDRLIHLGLSCWLLFFFPKYASIQLPYVHVNGISPFPILFVRWSNVVGLENLQEFHMELMQNYIDENVKIESNIFGELTNIFRNINDKSDRKAIKIQLHKLYEAADHLDSKIIDILINLVNKLPGNILINEVVKEFELITIYLDPVLSPIFHDPQKNYITDG